MSKVPEKNDAEQRCGDLRREAQESIKRIKKYMSEMRANLELLGVGGNSGERGAKQSDSSATATP